jgi:hypothetical protein
MDRYSAVFASSIYLPRLLRPGLCLGCPRLHFFFQIICNNPSIPLQFLLLLFSSFLVNAWLSHLIPCPPHTLESGQAGSAQHSSQSPNPPPTAAAIFSGHIHCATISGDIASGPHRLASSLDIFSCPILEYIYIYCRGRLSSSSHTSAILEITTPRSSIYTTQPTQAKKPRHDKTRLLQQSQHRPQTT